MASVPVLAITADPALLRTHAAELAALGAIGLAKPFDLGELAQLVGQLLC